MTDNDRIDICEAMYGKIEKVFNKFYRSIDRKHFIHIETGKDLLECANYSWTSKQHIHVTNSKIVKVCKEVVVQCENGIVSLFGRDCNVKAKIKKDITADTVKEFIAKKSNVIVYSIGRRTVATNMTVCILSYDTQEMLYTFFNVIRIFDSPERISITLLENGKMSTLDFER